MAIAILMSCATQRCFCFAKRRAMFRSILLIVSGNAANAVLLLIRNLLVARLISVENYGIASTFAVAIAIIEMASTFGLQQLLIQDKRGDDPYFQAVLQGFQVLRGLINGTIMFLLAGSFAQFMGVPEITWAHQCLALILVFNGFVHFDAHRLNRHMNYRAAAVVAMLSPIGALLVVWPLYLIFGNYQVMLWSMILQAATNTLVTHLVAERPYRLAWDPKVMAQSLRFGWPLLIDGLLLFAIFNGEKVIVGREFGMEPLALFSMAITLTLTPALIFQKTGSSFFLPQVSAARDPVLFRHLAQTTLQAHLLCAVFLVAGVAVCGGPFVDLVLGAKYTSIEPYLILLGVMQALRVIKGGGATVSLARARTSNGMVANILRVAVLPVAWYVAIRGGNVTTIIWIGIAGEAMGVAVSLALLRHQLRLSIRPVLAGLAGTLALLGVAGLGAMGLFLPAGWVWVVLAGLVVLPLTMPDLRDYLRRRTMTHHGDA